MHLDPTQPLSEARAADLAELRNSAQIIIEEVGDAPGPLDLLSRASDARALSTCIDSLSAQQRQSVALAFYDGRCLDPSGGFFHFFKDDGTVYDRRTRHLVSSTRFVFNHAMAFRHFGKAEQQAAVRHGLDFLQRAHAQPQGGYAWQVDWQGDVDGGRATVQDGTNHCYGLAFVLLAHAHALMAEQDRKSVV